MILEFGSEVDLLIVFRACRAFAIEFVLQFHQFESIGNWNASMMYPFGMDIGLIENRKRKNENRISN